MWLQLLVRSGLAVASVVTACAYKIARRPPLRCLFMLFLLAGVNLEANIGIAKKHELKMKKRAAEIAALDGTAYVELLQEKEHALRKLSIVSSCQLQAMARHRPLNHSFARVYLNCPESCGQEASVLKLHCSHMCPTVAQAAEYVLDYLLEHHAGCMETLAETCEDAGCSCAGGCSSSPSTQVDAFKRMQETQRRAAEQKAAQTDLERAQKRLRITAPERSAEPETRSSSKHASAPNEDIPHWHKYSTWDLRQFRTRMGEHLRRRHKIVSSEVNRPAPNDSGTVEKDAMLHWRRGLVGAVQDWADGSLENVFILLVRLVNHFNSESPGFKDQLVQRLTDSAALKDAVLHSQMIAKAREAIQVLKSHSHDEESRRQYLAALALFAPEAGAGMEFPFAQELGVQSGERTHRGKKRPRAFRRAMQIRAVFRERQTVAASNTFKVGDAVLCRGEKAVLTAVNAGGGCSITFGAGAVTNCVEYASMMREPKQSGRTTKVPCARLRHVPPTLLPANRVTRSDTVDDEVKAEVREVYETHCATSPHQRDSMVRRLSRYVVEKAQALIMTSTFDELYEAFRSAHHQGVKLSYTKFKMLAPWNLKRAYRETCVCRCCELFRLYLEGLHIVADLLVPLTTTLDEDDDDAAEEGADAEPTDEAPAAELVRLAAFCKHERKSIMVNDLVCGGNLTTAKEECIRGACAACGFKRLWSGPTGLRSKLVDRTGKLLPGGAPVWQRTMKWETLKSGKPTPSDGSPRDEKDGLRERKQGTLIQFLDEFEDASVKFPAHRYLIGDVKRAAKERDEALWPGMLVANYDWSENGTILNAIQIQSEYWSMVHYSLFICITSYLKIGEWCSRTSYLPVGAKVTVEPEGESTPNSLEPAIGSYFATVVRGPTHLDFASGNPGDTYLQATMLCQCVPCVFACTQAHS